MPLNGKCVGTCHMVYVFEWKVCWYMSHSISLSWTCMCAEIMLCCGTFTHVSCGMASGGVLYIRWLHHPLHTCSIFQLVIGHTLGVGTVSLLAELHSNAASALLKRLLASAESRKTQIKWGEMYCSQNASVWSLLKEGRKQPHPNRIWENSFASCPPFFSPTPLLISAVSVRKAQVVGSTGIKSQAQYWCKSEFRSCVKVEVAVLGSPS